MDGLLTAAQAARRLRVSKRRVLQFIAAKRLPATRIGNILIIRQDDLEKFAAIPRQSGRPRGKHG